MLTDAPGIEVIGGRGIPEFEGVHEVWPRGERLEAVRSAAAAYHERFGEQGEIHAVRSYDIAAASYPTKFPFPSSAIPPNPYVSIITPTLIPHFHDFPLHPPPL